jgi:hypothetical protein
MSILAPAHARQAEVTRLAIAANLKELGYDF